MTNVSSLIDVITDLEVCVADCRKAYDDHDHHTLMRCFEGIEVLMNGALDLHGRFTDSKVEPEVLKEDLQEARRVLGISVRISVVEWCWRYRIRRGGVACDAAAAGPTSSFPQKRPPSPASALPRPDRSKASPRRPSPDYSRPMSIQRQLSARVHGQAVS